MLLQMLCILLPAVVLLLPHSNAEIVNITGIDYGTSTQAPIDTENRNKLAQGVIHITDKFHNALRFTQEKVHGEFIMQNINYVMSPWEIHNMLIFVLRMLPGDNSVSQLYQFMGVYDTGFSRKKLMVALEHYFYNVNKKPAYGRFRRVIVDNAFFIRGNHTIHKEFMRTTKHEFRSQFYNVTHSTDEEVLEYMRNYVVNKSNHVLTNADYINETDFLVALMGHSYVQADWHSPFSTVWEMFYCIDSERKYKMRMNRKEIWGYYIDEPDRFAVIIPMKPGGEMGILFYVPKTHELFKSLDTKMNFSILMEMRERLLSMSPVQIEVTFPLFNMSLTRNIKVDMQNERLKNIFILDAVSFPEMTDETMMYIKNVYHSCAITMDDRRLQLASNTYLTFNQNLIFSKRISTLYAAPRNEISDLSSRDMFEKKTYTIGKEQNYLRNKKKLNTSATRKNFLVSRCTHNISQFSESHLNSEEIITRHLPLQQQLIKFYPFKTSTADIKKCCKKYFPHNRFNPKVNRYFYDHIKALMTNKTNKNLSRLRNNNNFNKRFKTSIAKRYMWSSNIYGVKKAFEIERRFLTTFNKKCSLHQYCSKKIGGKSRNSKVIRENRKMNKTPAKLRINKRDLDDKEFDDTIPLHHILINTSFFYAIIHRYDHTIFGVGKAFNCPDVPFEEEEEYL